MGKTGTTTWAQVKNTSGKIRLVRGKEAASKKPGPNQRFKPSSTLRKIAIQAERQQGRGRPQRSGARRGRGGRSHGPEIADQRVRRRMPRSKATAMGVKQKSR